jgi:hypothetical protein
VLLDRSICRGRQGDAHKRHQHHAAGGYGDFDIQEQEYWQNGASGKRSSIE